MDNLSHITIKGALFFVLLLGATACAAPFGLSDRVINHSANFAVLSMDPLSPVPVGSQVLFSTAHSDAEGVDRVEFYVNGQLQGQPQSPAFPQTYFVVENTWTPPAGGQYEIKWITYSSNADKDPVTNTLSEAVLASSRIIAVATIAGTAVPTEAPKSLPGGVVACSLEMLFIDQKVKDGTTMPPRKPFRMGWRVQNTGTCTWDTTYYINHHSGNNFGAGKTYLSNIVRPGEIINLEVSAIAPEEPGPYQSGWLFFHPDGRTFGPELKTNINVLPAKCFKYAKPEQGGMGQPGKGWNATPMPTPTTDPDCVDEPPPPTQCNNPPKIAYFTANPSSIPPGGSSILNWSVDGATSIVISPSTGVQTAGSALTVTPDQTTTYTLTASNGNCQSTAQVTVTVETQSCGGLEIVRFDANPPTINRGNSSTLSWVVNNATSVVISPGTQVQQAQVSSVLAGTLPVTPDATTDYTLSATNNVCTSNKSIRVTVN